MNEVEQLEQQVKTLEKMYQKDTTALKLERDYWKEKAESLTEDKQSSSKPELRHV